jgi:hypothetical protein
VAVVFLPVSTGKGKEAEGGSGASAMESLCRRMTLVVLLLAGLLLPAPPAAAAGRGGSDLSFFFLSPSLSNRRLIDLFVHGRVTSPLAGRLWRLCHARGNTWMKSVLIMWGLIRGHISQDVDSI